MFVFLFKQKTAYEMRISDWSSDVCSSDLKKILHCRFIEINLVDILYNEIVSSKWNSETLEDEITKNISSLEVKNKIVLIKVKGKLLGKRSEERSVGKSVSVRVDLGGRRIIKKKRKKNKIKKKKK